MYVLRKLWGFVAFAGGLAVIIYIGRYSSFGTSAVQPETTNIPSQNIVLQLTKSGAKTTPPPSKRLAKNRESAAPEIIPPEALLAKGLRDAKRDAKHVLLQVSEISSEESNTLADFIDENLSLFRPDFVLVRVAYEDMMIAYQQLPAVQKLMKRLRRANSRSHPWIAILDSEGRVLSDSDGPSGNVGCPSTLAEIAYFGEMLRKGTTPASAARIATIEQKLRANQERWKDAAGRGRLPIEKSVTPRDVAVLYATFKHFAEHEHWLSGHPPEATMLVVHTETNGKYPFVLARPRENYLNLVSRNAEKTSLRGLPFGKGVIVEDPNNFRPLHFGFQDQVQKKYPHIKRSCYVYLWLPGYSNDRKTAVVRFRFGPNAHGAAATYLLRNDNGLWIVASYDLAYFI